MIDYQIKFTKNWLSSRLPKRPKDANKGTFGKVLVIAGSQNYPGAAYLCCASAYRVGAGLVTLASIPSVCNIVTKKLPEVTLIPLPEKDGLISDLAAETLYENLSEFSEEDVMLLGPGLNKKESTTRFVGRILEIWDLPSLVIDGDGLNMLSKTPNWWEVLDQHFTHAILTPHPKEMSRLTDFSVDEIQSNRKEVADKFATKWGQVVVLKGANTVVASPSGEYAISSFANPALATAGTGDVLAGIIAGLLAQGLNQFDAAALGVYIHGMAGEMAKEKVGDAGMLASDLLSLIPRVLLNISKQRIS